MDEEGMVNTSASPVIFTTRESPNDGYYVADDFPSVVPMLFVSMVLVCVFNFIVIATIVSSARLRKIQNVFIVNLAIADFLYGGVGNSLKLYMVKETQTLVRNATVCKLVLTFTNVIIASSALSLLGASVERFIALVRPLRYHSLVTRQRAAAAIALIWSIIVFVMLVPLVSPSSDDLGFANCYGELNIYMLIFAVDATFLISSTGSVIIYCAIYVITRRHSRHIQQHRINNAWGENRTRVLAISKATKVLLIITLSQMFVWISTLINQLTTLRRIWVNSKLLYYFLLAVSCGAPILNPMIFAFKTQEVREIILGRLRNYACNLCSTSRSMVRPSG